MGGTQEGRHHQGRHEGPGDIAAMATTVPPWRRQSAGTSMVIPPVVPFLTSLLSSKAASGKALQA